MRFSVLFGCLFALERLCRHRAARWGSDTCFGNLDTKFDDPAHVSSNRARQRVVPGMKCDKTHVALGFLSSLRLNSYSFFFFLSSLYLCLSCPRRAPVLAACAHGEGNGRSQPDHLVVRLEPGQQILCDIQSGQEGNCQIPFFFFLLLLLLLLLLLFTIVMVSVCSPGDSVGPVQIRGLRRLRSSSWDQTMFFRLGCGRLCYRGGFLPCTLFW